MIISQIVPVEAINPPSNLVFGTPDSDFQIPNGFGSNRALRIGNYSPFAFQITGVLDNTNSSYVVSPYTMNLYRFDNIRGPITMRAFPLSADITTFPPNMHVSVEFADDAKDFGGSYPANLGGTSLMTINQGITVPGAPPMTPIAVTPGSGGFPVEATINAPNPLPVTIVGGSGSVKDIVLASSGSVSFAGFGVQTVASGTIPNQGAAMCAVIFGAVNVRSQPPPSATELEGFLRLQLDGVNLVPDRYYSSSIIAGSTDGDARTSVEINYVVASLPAGAHTVNLRVRNGTGNIQNYENAYLHVLLFSL